MALPEAGIAVRSPQSPARAREKRFATNDRAQMQALLKSAG